MTPDESPFEDPDVEFLPEPSAVGLGLLAFVIGLAVGAWPFVLAGC